uniref:LIM zinc-binding domain-containing protein n=1 Tax=Fundulus heteroclitus TaxID=8078 RepID=A0A3Q2QIW7_FUNHE
MGRSQELSELQRGCVTRCHLCNKSCHEVLQARGKSYHPTCFRCAVCRQELRDGYSGVFRLYQSNKLYKIVKNRHVAPVFNHSNGQPFGATSARLAQSVEHETLNLRVVGSSPTLGVNIFHFYLFF